MKTDRIFEFFASAQPEQVRLCARFNEMVRFPAVLRRILPVLFATVLCMACSDDDTDARPYLHVVDDLYEVNYDVEGGVQDFVMYSSYGHWTLQTTYAEDEEWLTAWPAEGDGDARFAVKVNKNDRAASRQATLNVVVEGESVATITFNQSGAEPVLKVDVKESGRTVSVKGETFNVGVEANLGWVAELVDPADAAWVTVGDYTDDMQTFVCAANESDTPREAKVTIKAYGTSLSQTFSIHQADRSSAFELAEKVTAAELLALGEGKIARNVYVEGTVISDRTTRNYPLAYLDEYTANTMFVEDATGGLWIEFDDAVDNTYDLNDDVAIHMYGQSIARDTYTNGLKIDGLTSSAVQSAVPGKGVEPIVVEDISQLSQYENRLVTLRDVEFVLPYGTLCNINEAVAAYGIEQPAKYQRSADYNDLTLEYGHYLRDGKGRLAKLYTSWSFTERGLHLIPEGAGDITGIVNKRYKADRYRPYSAVRQKEESWCIRVRRESDITNFSASDATRHSKTVMQIGPWSLNKTALPEIVASVGKGRLKHSVGVTVKGSTTGTTDEMYWAWAHVRNGAATFDAGNDRWLPAYGNATTVQYTAVMAQNWWKNTAAQYSSTDGCCWILTDLSTVGYTGALSIAFTASSNTIGPIEFQMEWADREDAAEWTPIGTPYVCANWHCDIHAPEYVFPLPDELKDRENFCIRLRATIQRNASDDADVANGTSRIGIVRISCLN